ncbi:MAG: trigger factor [Sedimentisphaerales bacterium]|nr:trigger factor [Sedimentisphaerales bacterium]
MAEEEQRTEEQTEEQPATTEVEQAEEAGEKKDDKPDLPDNIVTIEDAGPCKKKVTIEIPRETIDYYTNNRYEELRKEAIVPGFRKGRAPRRLIEKRFGKEATEQIKLTLLAEASEAAIKDNEIDSLGEPDIDYENIELPEEGPMKFDFEMEVRPEFELPELEGIAVTKTKLEVTDEQVDAEIEQMLKWSGIWTPRSEGAIEPEDQIVADVLIKVEGLEEQEKLDNAEIFVRKNGFVGRIPVEKLDEFLVGAKAGQTKEFSVDVPKTYFREEYRGKKVDIKIEIKDVKWLKPAELDDIFLQRAGVESEDELRENIHNKLQSQLERQIRNEMSEQIYKYLHDKTEFDLPLDIVAQQADTVLRRQYANLLMKGVPREQISEYMEQLQAGSEEQARRQLKTFFIMDKVADKLGINVSEEEINGYIAQLAVQRNQRPERMREQMEHDGSLAQFSLEVRQEKCIEKLLETAKITEKKPDKKAEKAAKASDKPKKKTAKKTVKKAAKKKTEKKDS